MLLVLFVLLIIWAVYLHLIPEKTTSLNYLYNLGYALAFFLGSAISFVGFFGNPQKSSLGLTAFFLGLGGASYGFGLVIWFYYNSILNIEVPYPSLADFFFIVFIPLIAIGCIKLLAVVGGTVKSRYIIEGLILFALSLILIIGFVVQPDLSSDLPFITKVTNILYPVGDSILLTLAYIIFRISGGKIQKAATTLVFSLLFQVLGDIFFSIRTVNETYWNGDIADVFFALSATFLTWSIITIYEGLTQTPETLSVPKQEATSL